MGKAGKSGLTESKRREAVKEMMRKRQYETMRAELDRSGKYKPKDVLSALKKAKGDKKKELIESIRKLIRSNLELHKKMLADVDSASLTDERKWTKKMKYAIYFVCIDNIKALVKEKLGSVPDLSAMMKALKSPLTLNELIHHEVMKMKREENDMALKDAR